MAANEQKKKRPGARVHDSRRERQNSASEPQAPGRKNASNARDGRDTRKRKTSA